MVRFFYHKFLYPQAKFTQPITYTSIQDPGAGQARLDAHSIAMGQGSSSPSLAGQINGFASVILDPGVEQLRLGAGLD